MNTHCSSILLFTTSGLHDIGEPGGPNNQRSVKQSEENETSRYHDGCHTVQHHCDRDSGQEFTYDAPPGKSINFVYKKFKTHVCNKVEKEAEQQMSPPKEFRMVYTRQVKFLHNMHLCKCVNERGEHG